MLLKAKGLRTYMPTTFDETMVEFGFKLERKKINEELRNELDQLEQAILSN